MRKNRILISKIRRLINLIDEENTVFFNEREWLYDKTKQPRIEEHEERHEIKIKIENTVNAIREEFRKRVQTKTLKGEQRNLL